MQFIYPYLLWGIAAVSIPVFIHLFRLRRFKTVLFSNTKMLKEVRLETKRKSKLKHLLILLLRMLTIIALVFAFARPYIPVGDLESQQRGRIVYIYIDNSFSMEAGESYHTRLDVAKNKAMEVAEGFGMDARYVLLTNRFDGSVFRTLTRSQLQEKIFQLAEGPYSVSFGDIILKFSELIIQNGIAQGVGFVISDFQKGFFEPEELPDSVNFPVFLVPLTGAPVINAGIDSVWLDSPILRVGNPVIVQARVRNYSQEVYEAVSVELYVENNRRSVASCDLGPGGTAIIEMSFVPDKKGVCSCYLTIQDKPVIYDDRMYFSFEVSDETNVLVIHDKNPINRSLAAVFKNEPLFNFYHSGMNFVEAGKIESADIIVLDALDAPSDGFIRELEEFVGNGGSLVIIPQSGEKVSGLNSLMARLGLDTYGSIINAELRISSLNSEHELFQGVFDGIPKDMDLPAVKKYFSMNATGTAWKLPLMKLQNDKPFLILSSVGDGRVYYFVSPFDQSNTDFHQHPLIVPVFYQMAFLSRKQAKIYYVIGNKEPIIFNFAGSLGEQGMNIKNTDATVDFLPQIRQEGSRVSVFTHQMINDAGNFMIYNNDTLVTGFAMNFNRSESVMEFTSVEKIDSLIKHKELSNVDILDGERVLTADIQLLMQGKQLWKIFLILALIFLAIEVILLRFWK